MARIFVVDDELYIQELYSQALPLIGHEIVEQAFNGEEAVQIYPTLTPRPDVTIMDYRMPIKNGLDATTEILRIDPAAKVLFISADQTIRTRVERIGIAGFLEKPFSLTVLQETIEGAMNGGRGKSRG